MRAKTDNHRLSTSVTLSLTLWLLVILGSFSGFENECVLTPYMVFLDHLGVMRVGNLQKSGESSEVQNVNGVIHSLLVQVISAGIWISNKMSYHRKLMRPMQLHLQFLKIFDYFHWSHPLTTTSKSPWYRLPISILAGQLIPSKYSACVPIVNSFNFTQRNCTLTTK